MAGNTDRRTGKKKHTGKPPSQQSIEERLKVFANVVVDRLMEEQENGNLRFKRRNL